MLLAGLFLVFAVSFKNNHLKIFILNLIIFFWKEYEGEYKREGLQREGD